MSRRYTKRRKKTKMKHNITTIKKAFEMLLRYASKKNLILTATRLHKLQKEIDDTEKKFRNMDFSEWIQEQQEELRLGYSKAQLLELFVKKEILGDGKRK